MTRCLVFHDGSDHYRFDDKHFPVTIGHSGVDIELPSVSAYEGVAYVDFSADRPFIQPEERSRVYLNGIQLNDSCWLEDGDLIRMGTAVLSCSHDREGIILSLLPPVADKKKPLKPPATPVNAEQINLDATTDIPAAKPRVKNADSRPVSLSWILGLVVFCALLLMVAFVFLATPVTLNIDPEPDDVALSGGLFSIKMNHHYLVWPGEYQVRIARQGYSVLEEPLEIRRGSPASFDFRLEKLDGLVQLVSDPETGVEIIINGQSVGKTPLAAVQLTPGQHSILFAHPRYQSDQQLIQVEGAGIQQTVTSRLIPDWAAITLASDPPGAKILVDGQAAGNTPAGIELQSGAHVMRLEKEGYQAWESKVTVQAGIDQELGLIKLAELPGIISLQSRPAGVSVLLDNRFQGQTPQELKLVPGREYELKLVEAGYQQLVRTVSAKSGSEQKLELKLTPMYGEIRIKGMPADATLYIDDKQHPLEGDMLRLTTRSHQLEVRKSGYRPYRTSVNPKQGYTGLVTVKLQAQGKPGLPPPATGKTAQARSGYALIRAGTFMMGASRREQGRRSNEVLHRVELTRPFYIGSREVSNADFRKFNPGHSSGQAKGLSLDDDRQPVVNVSWNDVARYCNWLSDQQGLTRAYREKDGKMVLQRPVAGGYRLPTEAEWAWVARYGGQAGKSLKYPWGQAFPVASESGNYAEGDRYAVSAPVASFKSDRNGIYDLGGNVSEWVNDYYSVTVPTGEKAVIDPLGPINGKHHVVRGAGWQHGSMSELRLSYRDYEQGKRPDLGFRVARYAD